MLKSDTMRAAENEHLFFSNLIIAGSPKLAISRDLS